MSRELIDKLTEYVNQGGNLVMSCRSGHQDEKGHLWEAPHAEPVYDLIGSEIEFYDLLKPHAPDTIVMKEGKYAWTSWGDVLRPNGKTETWGVYSGDFYAGKTAVSFHKKGRGTVTYIGADSNRGDLEHDVLKKLYGRINIPVEDYPEGIIVEYRDGFGIAMNYSDKDYEMILPDNAKILIGEPKIPTAGVLVWKTVQ
jgi:beta-galactosidase